MRLFHHPENTETALTFRPDIMESEEKEAFPEFLRYFTSTLSKYTYFNFYFESQVIHDMLKLTCYYILRQPMLYLALRNLIISLWMKNHKVNNDQMTFMLQLIFYLRSFLFSFVLGYVNVC